LPNGHFAERTVCRTDNLPKIEISSELFKVQNLLNFLKFRRYLYFRQVVR
jgi:hypothetical protein